VSTTDKPPVFVGLAGEKLRRLALHHYNSNHIREARDSGWIVGMKDRATFPLPARDGHKMGVVVKKKDGEWKNILDLIAPRR